MPSPNTNDPLRTTDQQPRPAPSEADVTTDFAHGPPTVHEGTTANVSDAPSDQVSSVKRSMTSCIP